MKWQHEVNFVDLWGRYRRDEVTLGEMSKEVEDTLLKLIDLYPSKWMRDELSEIAHDFGSFALSACHDEEGFDLILERLYTFGDRGKALWIKTQEWQR